MSERGTTSERTGPIDYERARIPPPPRPASMGFAAALVWSASAAAAAGIAWVAFAAVRGSRIATAAVTIARAHAGWADTLQRHAAGQARDERRRE